MNTVHVAVDAHNLARDDRGIGRYARAVLTRGLRAEGVRWTFVTRELFPNRVAIARALGTEPRDLRVTNRVPRDADVVWFPWNGTFLNTRVPSVATVHDAAPFAFPAADAKIRAREQTPFLKTAATARRILVQSAFTASEVETRLGVNPACLAVTPLACDAIFAPGDSPAPPQLGGRRYVLHVGAHDARKNTATLIDAHARAFPDGDVALVFSRRPPSMPPFGVAIEARDDATLLAMYRNATLVAVPSTYEGFGLPLLEGLACGTPALAARATALPEVGGDACAYVDDVRNADAWAHALRALVGDDALRSGFAARGPARAATFSWERCTAQTIAVLREVGGAEA